MPNWCSNTTTIQGSLEKLEWLVSVHFDFEVLRPRPQDDQDWYDWCIRNWGTKWPAQDIETELNLEERTLVVSYRTAWSPPTELLTYLSSEHQLVMTNYYCDEAYGFVGQSVIQNGDETSETLEPYRHDDNYLRDYAANHSWFHYQDYSEFHNSMMGQ